MYQLMRHSCSHQAWPLQNIITCPPAFSIKEPSSGLCPGKSYDAAMRERIHIDAGSLLITFQRGHPQGSTPEHLKSQLLDSGSPPRVVARQPRASEAVPALQQVQGMMSTAPPPVVLASHASTIPGLSLDFARASTLQYMSPNFGPKPGTTSGQEMQVMASEQMQTSTASSQAMEMERSRSRNLERQLQLPGWLPGAGASSEKVPSTAWIHSAYGDFPQDDGAAG